ncbi:MAG: hypothetical protein IKK61_05770 [Clostridia bacterium]|nr:hypothetical protein [Clostridia bacterium]
MAEKRTRNRFRGDLWLEQQVDQRVKAALRQKQEAFVEEHQEDTEEQLLDYVRQEAAKLRYTPNPGDLVGGPYIYKRFGNWDRVVDLCGLPKPGKLPPLKSRTIYKEEYQRQLEQFRQERRSEQETRAEAVQARKEQAKLQEEARAERDLLWGEAHENDTDEQLLTYLRQCAERLGHSPVKAEVEGGAYIAKRFITWPLALQLAELPLPKGMKPAGNKDVNAYRRLQKVKNENIPRDAAEIDTLPRR